MYEDARKMYRTILSKILENGEDNIWEAMTW